MLFGVQQSRHTLSNLVYRRNERKEFSMNFLREERKRRGWSQVMLSLKTGGIAPSDLSAIERGKKVAHPGWRKRIARALKVDEATLFGDK